MPLSKWWGSEVKKLAGFSVIFFVFAIFIFSAKFTRTAHHFFLPLSESMIQGKLYVPKMEFALHEMVSETEIKSGIPEEPRDGVPDKYYVIYPPMPAVVLIPFVLLFGPKTNQSTVSALIAAVSVYVAMQVFRTLKLKKEGILWMTALYAFGSMLWYHAAIGSAWYFAQVCALLFLWLAILALLKNKSMLTVAILLGMAYLSRFPAILAAPFFLLWKMNDKDKFKNFLDFATGISIFLGISWAYNWVRYGTISNYGYWLLEHRWYNLANEYAKGSYDLSYLPRHIKAMFWSFPQLTDKFPYFLPDSWSMAIWIVFPALLLTLLAPWKEKIVKLGWIAIICILPASLFHGGVGASQFGYRYALDYMPFILILIAESMRNGVKPVHKILVTLSILANVWGIYSSFWLR